MRGTFRAFNGLVRGQLVRRGVNEKLRERTKNINTLYPVYSEMLLQISRDYSGLPDVRTLKLHEILFFYNGLRAELQQHTKPKG